MNEFDAVFGGAPTGATEPQVKPAPFDFGELNKATEFKVLPAGTYNVRVKSYSHKVHEPYKDGVKRAAYDWILAVTDEGENFGVTIRHTTNYGIVKKDEMGEDQIERTADTMKAFAFFLRAIGLLDDPAFAAGGSVEISDEAVLNRRLTIDVVHKPGKPAEDGTVKIYANVGKVMNYAPEPGSRWVPADLPF